MAIHNIDENNLRDHTRRLQALDEAARTAPGGGLVVADFWTGAHANHLHQHGLIDIMHRSLGWRFWYLPGFGAGPITATKPARPVDPAQPQ